MNNFDGFRKWLHEKTNYSERTIGNIVSRLKRADKILPWFNDDVYLFRLQKKEEYTKLTVSVRSQVKKAVELYYLYISDMDNNEE